MAAKKTSEKRVVVRTYSAGVHTGILVSREGKEVVLRDARRIWHWRGANTLHEVATTGVSSGSKISVPVDEITLTEAIEVISCTPAAAKSIASAGWSS